MAPTPEDALGFDASFRGVRARKVVEYVDVLSRPERLSQGGFWVLVGDFEGRIGAWRCAEVERVAPVREPREHVPTWVGPAPEAWESSLSREDYVQGVERIRRDIREGDVYQVNLCRVLSAPLPAAEGGPDARALSERLAKGNPARFASRITISATKESPGAWIVSASPELYLSIQGDRIASSPIKGTAAPGVAMLDKDSAENVMITDLIRNDLSHVAIPGSVRVPEFLAEHQLPGMVHLQSTVEATLASEFAWTSAMWGALLDGTFPPGSVSGAPKLAALEIIAREETAPRGPYCGALGWIDADAQEAELAVGIRTFWWTPDEGGKLHFGTGAGITWGSDPIGEWDETELKARRLIALASTATMSP